MLFQKCFSRLRMLLLTGTAIYCFFRIMVFRIFLTFILLFIYFPYVGLFAFETDTLHTFWAYHWLLFCVSVFCAWLISSEGGYVSAVFSFVSHLWVIRTPVFLQQSWSVSYDNLITYLDVYSCSSRKENSTSSHYEQCVQMFSF